jgi:hypothetical protein
MENQNESTGQQTINVQIPSVDNIASRRPLIPFSFALAIFFFFFAFCDLKCGGQKIASIKGIELVTGTTIKDHDMMSGQETKGEEIPPSMWAILAFGVAVIGLGAFLIKEKREAIIGTGAGAIGAGSLIILQFVIKSGMDEKGKGQIDCDFQFPYWGALIALGVAGLISYLRMRQTHNVVVNFSPPPQATSASPTAENISQPHVQSVIQPTQQASGFDLAEWLKKNSKKVIAAVISIFVLYGAYYLFLRHDPINDAKKVSTAYCDCTTKYNDAMIKADEEFVKSFDTYGFKKRQEARNKLQELQSSVNTEYTTCNSETQQKYNDLRNRYTVEQEMLSKFDFAYNSQSGTCNPSNQSKLTSMNSEIESKISTIKDPTPDIEKIKSDLIGSKIPGWNFDFLSEFQKCEITKTNETPNRLEYNLSMTMLDQRNGNTYPVEAIVTYMQNDQGWYFNGVKLVYIEVKYTAPVNNWQGVVPYQNCNYKIIDKGQRFWVQDGSYGSKYKAGGSDADTFYLRGTEIFLMSREDHPVDLVFIYTPTN